LVRGFKPWPSAFSYYKGEMVKMHDVEALDDNLPGRVGEIVKVDKKNIYVKALSGLVKIVELQFPGKRKMLVEDFLKGNKIEEGEILK